MTTDLAKYEVEFRKDGLTIGGDLPFNEWRRIGEQILSTTDRALWSLGDWWLYGNRYAKDYHDGLAAMSERSRLIAPAARTARTFDHSRRRGQLAFDMHEAVASLPETEQEARLDEAERQGWHRSQLQLAQIPQEPPKALSVKIVNDHYDMAVAAAARRNMDPRLWVMEAIAEKHGREMGAG